MTPEEINRVADKIAADADKKLKPTIQKYSRPAQSKSPATVYQISYGQLLDKLPIIGAFMFLLGLFLWFLGISMGG